MCLVMIMMMILAKEATDILASHRLGCFFPRPCCYTNPAERDILPQQTQPSINRDQHDIIFLKSCCENSNTVLPIWKIAGE